MSPRLSQMTPEQILDQLRAAGKSEAEVATVGAAMERSAERRRLIDPEVDRLRDKWLAVDVPKGWIVRDRGPDGGVADHPHTGRRVILSLAREDDGEVWLHASISRRDRALPTYDDLRMLHATFMPGLVAYQLFVPEGEHVNMAEVLHLWACLTKRVTPDFTSSTGSV